MRVLGIGESCDLGDLYRRLLLRGHEVRVFASDPACSDVLRGIVPRCSDWREELGWVGREGLIVFEVADLGAEQDELRRDGYRVIGGGAFGERLENDRAFGQAALRSVGLQTARVRDFSSFADGIEFVRKHPARYVFKLNGNFASTRNYVGRLADGADVIAVLESQDVDGTFVLMEHLDGIEMGTGAYFDGRDFLAPACLDWEHKRFFPGDLGELTGEMGTVVTYSGTAKFFEATLGKLAPLLREHGYCGYINLNTIVNGDGVWPLELTCRFGYPGFAILDALHIDSWDLILQKMALRGGPVRVFDGFAVGVVMTVPPFPYPQKSAPQPVLFDGQVDEFHLHFGELMLSKGRLMTSGPSGYALVVTGRGETIPQAQQAAYALAARVHIPNVRYRNDIGNRVDLSKLQKLGWL